MKKRIITNAVMIAMLLVLLNQSVEAPALSHFRESLRVNNLAFLRGSPEERMNIYQNQMVQINDIFELNAWGALSTLERSARAGDEPGMDIDTFGIGMSVTTPRYNDFDYKIIRNGEELAQKTETLFLDDMIILKPKRDCKIDDFVVSGATGDTPPVHYLTPDSKIRSKLTEEYYDTYPCGRSHAIRGNTCPLSDVPVFTARKVEVNENATHYIAENGYAAYIIPLKDGKKGGIQIFCELNSYWQGWQSSAFGSDFDCSINTDNWEVECRPLKEGLVKLEAPVHLAYCSGFLDTITTTKGTYKANMVLESAGSQFIWIGPWSKKEYNTILFQVIEEGEKAPIADFTYKITGEKGTKLVFDASLSSDPDGTIESYKWDFGGASTRAKPYVYRSPYTGRTYKTYPDDASLGTGKTTEHEYVEQGEYSVTLTVTDNDGLIAWKTKTANLTQKPTGDFKFIANYDTITKKALIKMSCQQGSVLIDIDQLDKQAEPTLAVIEKQSIPCNQTTEIGPIETSGGYEVTAIINGERETAHFTVP